MTNEQVVAASAERNSERRSRVTQSRRFLLLLAPFVLAITFAVNRTPATDPDIWWHLRTGEWIVQHHTVPTGVDPFSTSGNVFTAYSWLFELAVYAMFRWLGLFGILLFQLILTCLIAGALLRLAMNFENRILPAIGMTCLAVVGMAPLYTPRPWLITVLLFTLELDILLRVRRQGNYRLLWLLPALFLVWANVHVQFVYGLFVLAVAALDQAWDGLALRMKLPTSDGTPFAWRPLTAVTCACALATFVNPNLFRLHAVIFRYMAERGQYDYVQEMTAMSFRQLANYCVLALLVIATFVIAYRKIKQPFFYLILIPAAVLGFRSQRDVWFLAVVALSAVAATAKASAAPDRSLRPSARQWTAVFCAVVLLCGLFLWWRRLSNSALAHTVKETYPVDAASYVEQNRLPGPLYNHFDWGGYLIWNLRTIPVSMDGRVPVYGDQKIEQSLNVWNGQPGWRDDSGLKASRVVIAKKTLPLSELLRSDAHFRVAYEDLTTVVFVRNHS